MKNILNKIIISGVMFLSIIFIGCKAFQLTQDNIAPISNVIGMASGAVVNMTDIDDTVKVSVIEIMNTAKEYLPQNGETCVSIWTPHINEKIKELINSNKLDAKYEDVVVKICIKAASGIDYLYNKYPVIQQYYNIAITAVDNFIAGFNSVINTTGHQSIIIPTEYQTEYEQAYEHMLNN
jgi:hypothetical protein